MFDVARARLVLSTPTYNMFTLKHTGYIFKLYTYDANKARELFFEDHAAVVLFATRAKADLAWDERFTPERVTALDFVMNFDQEEHFPEGGEYHGLRGAHMKRSGGGGADVSTPEMEDEFLGEESSLGEESDANEIDFFGEG